MKTNLNIQTKKEIKNQKDDIFNAFGLNMTTTQFNQMMATGLHQAKAGESFDINDVFNELEKR
jgi:uncharacterized protein YpuA (DUF1002 family)